MFTITLMTKALLNELLFWMRFLQLQLEAREVADCLIEVFEAQNNENYSRLKS